MPRVSQCASNSSIYVKNIQFRNDSPGDIDFKNNLHHYTLTKINFAQQKKIMADLFTKPKYAQQLKQFVLEYKMSYCAQDIFRFLPIISSSELSLGILL